MSFTIGACGFSATGSSIITDYLREFDDIVVYDEFEFSMPYRCDGLSDLKYHLHNGAIKFSSFASIRRFERLSKGYSGKILQKATNGRFSKLTEQYLNEIIQAQWTSPACLAMDEPVRNLMARILQKTKWFELVNTFEEKRGHDLNIYPLHRLSYSINPVDFDEKTKRYVMGILDAMGRKQGKSIVLDQPFAGNNPQAVFPFFENPRAVVVDRDPRDYYLFYRKFLYKKGWRQVPVFDLEGYVKYYRNMRDNMPYKENRSDIMRINFEELIYDYENATRKLRKFCGVSNHARPRKYFDPAKSINNTQIFKRFPQYTEEIKFIEDNLTEYLFPYEKYTDIKLEFGEMFCDSKR